MLLKNFKQKLITLLILSLLSSQLAHAELTDQQIAQTLIRQSIAEYPGNCPCPYNTDRAGRVCGKRSAYSKPDGYSPLCYVRDITPEIEHYKSTN